MSRAQQAVKEFRAAVVAEFAFLPTEFGFVEEAPLCVIYELFR